MIHVLFTPHVKHVADQSCDWDYSRAKSEAYTQVVAGLGLATGSLIHAEWNSTPEELVRLVQMSPSNLNGSIHTQLLTWMWRAAVLLPTTSTLLGEEGQWPKTGTVLIWSQKDWYLCWASAASSEKSKCKWSVLSENGLEDLPSQNVWSWSKIQCNENRCLNTFY